MTSAHESVGGADEIDEIAVLHAVERWSEAEACARARLERLHADPDAPPLALARATRWVADVIIDGGRAEEATPWVVEARGHYRRFAREPGPTAEIHWTVARHAFATRRSQEAEEALDVALRATAGRPELVTWRARALRFGAHLSILRGDFAEGAALIDEAMRGLREAGPAGRLLLADLAFTRAEVHVILEDAAGARAAAAGALDLVETRFAGDSLLREHGRARAARVLFLTGDLDPSSPHGAPSAPDATPSTRGRERDR